MHAVDKNRIKGGRVGIWPPCRVDILAPAHWGPVPPGKAYKLLTDLFSFLFIFICFFFQKNFVRHDNLMFWQKSDKMGAKTRHDHMC